MTTVAELEVLVRASTAQATKGMADLQKQLGNVEKQNQQLAKSNADLNKQLDQIQRSTSRMSNEFSRAATVARQFIGVIAAGQLVRFATNVLEADAAMGRLSQQTGIGIQRLSELKFAAEQTGVPFQVLEQAIAGFSQRMAEGLANASSAVSLALRGIGVSARDAQGQLRSFDQFLPEVADRFAAMTDGVNKTQIAVALFGEEAGRRLIPLLNQGRNGIAALTEEARRLGVVLDEDGVRRAQEFQRASLQLNAALEETVRELTALAAPTIITALQTLNELFRNLRGQLPGTGRDVNTVARELQGVQVRIFDLQQTLRRAGQTEGATGWIFRQLYGATAPGEIEELTRRELALLLEFQQLTRNQPTSGEGGKRGPPGPDLAAMQEAQRNAQFELENLTARITGQRTVLDELSIGWNTHAQAVVRANELIATAYGNTAEARRSQVRLEQQLALQQQAAILSTATLAAQTLTALFPKQKGAAIAAAVMNTGVAVTKALSEVPWPMNLVQAGLISAMGAAQIASISSASPSGGSLAGVGGGSGGGGDSGTPTMPEEAEDKGRSVTIVMREGAVWSSAQVRELLDAMNKEVSNGATNIATETKRF